MRQKFYTCNLSYTLRTSEKMLSLYCCTYVISAICQHRTKSMTKLSAAAKTYIFYTGTLQITKLLSNTVYVNFSQNFKELSLVLEYRILKLSHEHRGMLWDIRKGRNLKCDKHA